MIGDLEFCQRIENDPEENFYFGCSDPEATFFRHPHWCTVYIQCLGGNKSISRCCPAIDTDHDGCLDDRLWFNMFKMRCDYPDVVQHRNCSVPADEITTSSYTAIPSHCDKLCVGLDQLKVSDHCCSQSYCFCSEVNKNPELKCAQGKTFCFNQQLCVEDCYSTECCEVFR